ncbi:hypothetical protein EHR03_13060 [Leptospira mayottensis]|uniref:Uncharacterized protein n=1 Tax=Leptospira mayottensis 200901116 TaxID=1192864 RepID=M6UZX9_9LEPT|nr:hypothetical protein [Leptospira mayottensis]AVH81581.1 hypothetical protein [Leptospira mayottensis 200901116]TGN00353.1 hypothetical protein EHR03_13060 [Leptospira mayottensis]
MKTAVTCPVCGHDLDYDDCNFCACEQIEKEFEDDLRKDFALLKKRTKLNFRDIYEFRSKISEGKHKFKKKDLLGTTYLLECYEEIIEGIAERDFKMQNPELCFAFNSEDVPF